MRPKGSRDLIADRRKRALRLLDIENLSLNEVARRIGCNASSVKRWRDQRAVENEGVYEVKTSPGRPQRLSAEQKKELVEALSKGPLANGYSTDLWTTARIAEVVKRLFDVSYHRDHIGRLMSDLGWSCQKPDRRALQRKEELIEQWKQEEWPRIKKNQRTWAPILFLLMKVVFF